MRRKKLALQVLLSKPELSSLKADWPHLGRHDRGRRLMTLLRTYSRRELAKAVGCSETTIRKYIDLASAPKSSHGNGEKKGAKKLIADCRARRRELQRWKTLTTGSNGAAIQKRLVRTLKKWLKQVVHPSCWRGFFEELTLPCMREEYRRYTPDWREVKIDGDWDKVIADTEPPEHDPSRLDLPFGYQRKWFAIWIQRCIPNSAIVRGAFIQARDDLMQEVRRMRYATWWYD